MTEPIYAKISKPRRPPLWRRWQVLVGVLVLCAGVGYLGYVGFAQSATYYMTVSELMAAADSLDGENVRISGDVLPGSVNWEPRSLRLEFALAEGGHTLPVVYQGAPPSAFGDDAEVVVHGKYLAGGAFEADEILTKCPSKYVPEE